MSTTSREHDRTTYEAALDVRYGIVLHRMNERLYNRLDAAMGVVGLLFGSAAFAGVAGGPSALLGAGGLVLAALAVLERVIGPARKAEQHKQAACAFAELDARLPGMQLPSIDAELTRLRASTPDGVSGLLMVAYNANLRTHGRTDYIGHMSAWSRLLAACV